MQFPQTSFGFHMQSTQTNYLSELAVLQNKKNRTYTQLKSNSGENSYFEANLGNVQLFRERLMAPVHIHAAPPSQFLPIAVPFSASTSFRFCGQERQKNSFLQATGDEWDISTDSQMDYAALVFDYASLNQQHQSLYQEDLPSHWLKSRLATTTEDKFNDYRNGIQYLLQLISETKNLFQQPKTCQFIAGLATQMALKTSVNTQFDGQPLSPQPRRITGVYRVIDYLRAFSSQLPSMSELCVVANLSERSLEYGFREHLGITPIRYLKVVRLNGAREALLTSDTQITTVSDVALRWGFLELGRFSAEYRKLFNELPSVTLKST